MSFRMVLGGALAVCACLAGAAAAKTAGTTPAMRAEAPVSAFTMGVGEADPAPIRVAQMDNPSERDLAAQIRELTGRVEELNFQILQMQDQMQRMQKDNEFRFQQLEGGSSGGGNAPPDKKSSVEQPPSRQSASNSTVDAIGNTIRQSGGNGQAASQQGIPPKTFGTITFDANGNVVSGALGNAETSAPLDTSGGAGSGPDNTTVASLPRGESADELYRNSYQFILSGDYERAERGFREHIKRFPDDPRAADANFWLGEALLGEDQYRDAAEVFLKANRAYPDARKAPEMLLKLGISLAAMNQRDVACATYAEIGKRYSDITTALKQRIKQERQLAGC